MRSASVASSHAISAGQALQVDGGRTTTAHDTTSALGSTLTLAGRTVHVDTQVALPSGQLTVQAGEGLVVDQHAQLDLAGRQVTLGSQQAVTAGGQASLGTDSGDLLVASGARIDVSGGGDQGAGGQLGLSAAHGRLQVLGELRGRAGSAAIGARLSADAAGLNLHRLMQSADDQSFLAEVDVRQRQGDLLVTAQDTVRARTIDLSADRGQLDVAGTLDARGADGGRIRLSASGDVGLLAGSQVLAQAAASDGQGGRVDLSTLGGRIHLDAGSLVDVSAGSADDPGLSTGRLALRAAQQGNDVAIDPLAGRVLGAGDRKSTRLNSSHSQQSRMPSSA